ncbi:MAG: DUF3800 domain-containing protein [Phormidium sp.]
MVDQNPHFFVDETGTDQNSKILAIACILTNDPPFLRRKLEELKQRLLKEPRYKDIPSVPNLRSKGFHYCEDHREVKSEFIELISKLPFEAYICYERKKSDFCANDGIEWYNRLFCKLMHDRLRKHKNFKVSICFEQHNNSVEKRRNELENNIKRLVQEIESKDGCKFISLPTVESAGKEEPCLSIADYIAAIFKDYEEAISAEDQDLPRYKNPATWQARNFTMISPKVRVIHNYGTGDFYDRRNPFR